MVRRPFGRARLPFLSCSDLAVAFFDRSKDWVDLEEMAAARQLDIPWVADVLGSHLGPDDHRIAPLRGLVQPI